jgi:hypothetical protein
LRARVVKQPTISVAERVARMERSAIRGRSIGLCVAPGFRCAPPGLRKNERKKEAERRQTHLF